MENDTNTTELFTKELVIKFNPTDTWETIVAQYYKLPSGDPVVFEFKFLAKHLEHARSIIEKTFSKVHPNLNREDGKKLESEFLGSWYAPIINQIKESISNETR